jgi:hypothetical protein
MQQSFARCGGRDAAGGTGQQAKHETRLELLDGVAERGL